MAQRHGMSRESRDSYERVATKETALAQDDFGDERACLPTSALAILGACALIVVSIVAFVAFTSALYPLPEPPAWPPSRWPPNPAAPSITPYSPPPPQKPAPTKPPPPSPGPLSPPWAPSTPPSAPPPPPAPPPSAAAIINSRMDSADGVIVHQNDGYIFDIGKGDMSGRAGRGSHGALNVVSCSIIQARQRTSFATIPVYSLNDAGRLGGIVLRDSAVRLACLYGADASSWNYALGGCGPRASWCDEYANASAGDDPCATITDQMQSYVCHCCTRSDCQGQPLRPWRPQHKHTFLSMFAKYGATYNEALLAGGREWNNGLPRSVEAFFYDVNLHAWDPPAAARRLRDGFAKYWGLDAADVPLLCFNRSDWKTPFRVCS